MKKLIAYQWRGNVRELANVIESAVVLGQGPELTPHDLPAKVILRAQSRTESGSPITEQ